MAELTPMMKQYCQIKAQQPDAILFFRLGDFYEMFFEDAQTAARELKIALTARDGGNGVRVPMCGVPYHAAEGYISRLTDRGYKVAICEQVEDPSQARGLVRREVVRLVTPGTNLDARLLGDARNVFLAALTPAGMAGSAGGHGLALVDISTGEFLMMESRDPGGWQWALDELGRYAPAELLCDEGAAERLRAAGGFDGPGVISVVPAEHFAGGRQRLCAHFGVSSLDGFGAGDAPLATAAAGAIMAYLERTQRMNMRQIVTVRLIATGEYLALDGVTRRNLELTARLADGAKQGSLLGVLDRTVTPMGGRLLRRWLERPLVDPQAIEARLDAVEELCRDASLRAEIREALKGMYDLERLMARVAGGSANGRDLLALRASLMRLPRLLVLLGRCRSRKLAGLTASLQGLEEPGDLIGRALADDPPVALDEGGLIRDGYDARVDELRLARREGKRWIASLEAGERERTGIKSLKVGFNKVFGYYIEVSNPNRHLVPPEYMRKQTLVNAERYVTPGLKEREEAVLTAEERLAALEYELFCALREQVARYLGAIQGAAGAVATLDVFAALAEVAASNRYVRPEISTGTEIRIEAGRHPVLEEILGPGRFVPNDAWLDGDGRRLLIITGPNMGGKSTLARQVALIVIMGQMGSFVPAGSCRLGLADRVFTRIGAADDLSSGRSTFMVEMHEVANILHNAADRSLVILDEVGRGTSTADGLSIARAVSEYIHDRVRARTIFTTHYHELTALEDELDGAVNLTVLVEEKGSDVVFLRRVVPGRADRSYGIQVARLAGLPAPVLERAAVLLGRFAAGAAGGGLQPAGGLHPPVAGPGLSEEEFLALAELERVDLLATTPLEAMNLLFRLQGLVRRAQGAAKVLGGS